MLSKFRSIVNAERLYRDHAREVRYPLRLPEARAATRPSRGELYARHPGAVAAAP